MLDTSTVDDVVRMSIEDLFPEQTIPDENNHVSRGFQYKAPDHLIMGGQIAIERKSRNAHDRSLFYSQLRTIAEKQGMPFWAVGRVNLKAIIAAIPDSAAANRQMTDFMMNQMMKNLRKCDKKFRSYNDHKPDKCRASVAILSDNTEIREGTASVEYFIGRKMGAINANSDELSLVDAVFYVKHPAYTLHEEDSYWFKAILREKLSAEKRRNISTLASAIHYRVGHYLPYFETARKFPVEDFRICLI